MNIHGCNKNSTMTLYFTKIIENLIAINSNFIKLI